MPEQLSANQEQFVKSAKAQGLKVDFSYSGRGMFGKTCPSVIVESILDFKTKAKVCWDNMGLKYVLYAKN